MRSREIHRSSPFLVLIFSIFNLFKSKSNLRVLGRLSVWPGCGRWVGRSWIYQGTRGHGSMSYNNLCWHVTRHLLPADGYLHISTHIYISTYLHTVMSRTLDCVGCSNEVTKRRLVPDRFIIMTSHCNNARYDLLALHFYLCMDTNDKYEDSITGCYIESNCWLQSCRKRCLAAVWLCPGCRAR